MVVPITTPTSQIGIALGKLTDTVVAIQSIHVTSSCHCSHLTDKQPEVIWLYSHMKVMKGVQL